MGGPGGQAGGLFVRGPGGREEEGSSRKAPIFALLTKPVRTRTVHFVKANYARALWVKLRALRKEREETLREVASFTRMDPVLLIEIEWGSRLPTSEQVTELANHFEVAENDLQAQRIAVDFLAYYGGRPSVRLALPIISEALGRCCQGRTGEQVNRR